MLVIVFYVQQYAIIRKIQNLALLNSCREIKKINNYSCHAQKLPINVDARVAIAIRGSGKANRP
ncbi:hypothetical protein NIES4073_06890 [Kalymmatonema gypsitolerans NIES-4073]|nr:hypothetical protein NIES4073_06890 [Scytonema sp. NIES-4073]